jgi:replication-associated recombination protein RarA
MNLYEKYRPQTFETIIGQDRAIVRIRAIGKSGYGGRAFWLSGPSGVGKTTLARVIAGQVADAFNVAEYDSADVLTASELDEIDRTMHLYGFGQKTGRAIIVNEAHGLRAPIVRRLLGMLERIPSHVVWIFTTTSEGLSLFEDSQTDASPLLSRCTQVSLTSQSLCRPFAEHCQRIAQTEGLDGKPIKAYEQLMRDCRNNMRMALQQVESGVMVAD